jgi:hypothetical protein
MLGDAKSFVVEGISLMSLILAGLALLLIELWGIKKIWRLFRSEGMKTGGADHG